MDLPQAVRDDLQTLVDVIARLQHDIAVAEQESAREKALFLAQITQLRAERDRAREGLQVARNQNAELNLRLQSHQPELDRAIGERDAVLRKLHNSRQLIRDLIAERTAPLAAVGDAQVQGVPPRGEVPSQKQSDSEYTVDSQISFSAPGPSGRPEASTTSQADTRGEGSSRRAADKPSVPTERTHTPPALYPPKREDSFVLVESPPPTERSSDNGSSQRTVRPGHPSGRSSNLSGEERRPLHTDKGKGRVPTGVTETPPAGEPSTSTHPRTRLDPHSRRSHRLPAADVEALSSSAERQVSLPRESRVSRPSPSASTSAASGSRPRSRGRFIEIDFAHSNLRQKHPPKCVPSIEGPFVSAHFIDRLDFDEETIHNLEGLRYIKEHCPRVHIEGELVFIYNPLFLESQEPQASFFADWGPRIVNQRIATSLLSGDERSRVLHTFVFPVRQKNEWYYVGALTWTEVEMGSIWEVLSPKAKDQFGSILNDRWRDGPDSLEIARQIEEGELGQLTFRLEWNSNNEPKTRSLAHRLRAVETPNSQTE
ncbi:hypothetical protein JAAARDRAFT_201690 [Jaapia argillacea MUCL 33604]|uniref:Uncharacterized protein n=1 Tax=Jaapia argillacea MUCL 33604 TaxID=933084 RepID=A0A067QBH4_9AGAM|nr:hypothetical protein JAAARDRAFT_201690 [Jaapia argillacea MUCL 33604]